MITIYCCGSLGEKKTRRIVPERRKEPVNPLLLLGYCIIWLYCSPAVADRLYPSMLFTQNVHIFVINLHTYIICHHSQPNPTMWEGPLCEQATGSPAGVPLSFPHLREGRLLDAGAAFIQEGFLGAEHPVDNNTEESRRGRERSKCER